MKYPHLELFYYNECFFCQKVLGQLDTLKIKVDFKNIYEDQNNMDRLFSETGRRTTPCLFIDGKPMFESEDIIEWLKNNINDLEKT